MARPRTDAREQLLARVVDHLMTSGVANLSLRELAAALGTSHRMLVYHFGSKDGLLAEVVRHVEAAQRAVFEAMATEQPEADTSARVRQMWAHWTDPATQRQERLFFEMVGMALRGDPAMRPLLDDLVMPWIAPVAAIRRAAGVAPADADADARLAIATTRGLLLDLLATDDVEGTTRAFERFGALLSAVEPEPAGAPAPNDRPTRQRDRKRSS